MSQWGAEGMARRGADYRRILATFFPGTELAGLVR
jgi:SpoIID/LytB domain protein